MFHCQDALEAEGSAIHEGMSLSIQWSELPILVQSNSSIAIAAFTDDSLDRSAYGHIIVEIKKLLNLRGFVPLKIERNQNRIAHCLAYIGRSGDSTPCWFAPCVR